jgi:hypothetical protein
LTGCPAMASASDGTGPRADSRTIPRSSTKAMACSKSSVMVLSNEQLHRADSRSASARRDLAAHQCVEHVEPPNEWIFSPHWSCHANRTANQQQRTAMRPTR